MEEDMKGTMYGRIPAVLLQGVTQESGSTVPGNCPTQGSGQCAHVTRLCDVTLARVQSMLFYDGYRRTYYLIEHKFKRAMSN